MDYSCHHCGATVAEGTAFCPQCGAPQIRVAIPSEAPATPPLPPGTPAEAQPPAEPVALGTGSTAVAPAGIDWSKAVPAAATAGVLLAMAWLIPGIGFVLWVVAAGLVAVTFYRRRIPGALLTPRLGARIGAISGLFGFGVFIFLMAMDLLASRGSGKFRQALQQVLQEAVARNPDPRTQQAMQQLMTPAGLAVLVTVAMVIFLILFLLLAAAGGALGGWLIGDRASQRRNQL